MKGEDLLLTVTVNDISGRISSEEKNQMIRALKKEASDAAVLQYFELSAELKIGEDDPIPVTNLPANRIQVTLTVPRKHNALGLNIDRTFYIAGLRSGRAEILAKGKNMTLQFTTDDLFSRYALACNDVIVPPSDPGGGGGSDPAETNPEDVYRWQADFRFELFPEAIPETDRERAAGYRDLINGLELQADLLRNDTNKGLDISAAFLPAGKPEEAFLFRIFGTQERLFIESPLPQLQPYELTGMQELSSPEAIEKGLPYILYEEKDGRGRFLVQWIRNGVTLLDLELEISGIPAMFPGETQMEAVLRSGGGMLPRMEGTVRLTMDTQGETELIVFVPDEEGNPEPLFRAFGAVTAVQADGEADSIPDFNSLAKEEVPALLNTEGRTLPEVLNFMTPDLAEEVLFLLMSVSEQGTVILTEDLENLGIFIRPDEQ
jgi:hypothetical protein